MPIKHLETATNLTVILRIQIKAHPSENFGKVESDIYELALDNIKRKHPEAKIFTTTLEGWDY